MSENNGNTKNGNRQEVIERDSVGRPRLIRADGHLVELTRLDSFDGLILTACYDLDSQPCQDNTTGFCRHCLEAIFTAAADAHVTITTTVRQDAAYELAKRLDARVLMARSCQSAHGEGHVYIVAARPRTAEQKRQRREYQYLSACVLSGTMTRAAAERRLAEIGYKTPEKAMV